MTKTINTDVLINELYKAFHIFNNHFYCGELPEPAILIQSRGNKKNVLGWCSINKIWSNSSTDEKKYEINLVAEYVNRGIEQVLATLLHEMVHLYCLEHGIKDTTRNYTYHNKKFKEVAESHGLICEHNEKIGWSITKMLPYQTIEFIHEQNFIEEAFTIARKDFEDGEEKKKKKSHIRKYVCPKCGQGVRASKEVKLICGECFENENVLIPLVWENQPDDEEPTEQPTDATEQPTEQPAEPVETPQTPQDDAFGEFPAIRDFTVDCGVLEFLHEYNSMIENSMGFEIGLDGLTIEYSDKLRLWATYEPNKITLSTEYVQTAEEQNIMETLEHLYIHHYLFVTEGVEKPKHDKHFKETCDLFSADSSADRHPTLHRPMR